MGDAPKVDMVSIVISMFSTKSQRVAAASRVERPFVCERKRRLGVPGLPKDGETSDWSRSANPSSPAPFRQSRGSEACLFGRVVCFLRDSFWRLLRLGGREWSVQQHFPYRFAKKDGHSPVLLINQRNILWACHGRCFWSATNYSSPSFFFGPGFALGNKESLYRSVSVTNSVLPTL